MEILQPARLQGASQHLRQKLPRAPTRPFHNLWPPLRQVDLPLPGLTKASRETDHPLRTDSNFGLRDRNNGNHAIVGSESPAIVTPAIVTPAIVTPAIVTPVTVILSKLRRCLRVHLCHAPLQMRSMKFGK